MASSAPREAGPRRLVVTAARLATLALATLALVGCSGSAGSGQTPAPSSPASTPAATPSPTVAPTPEPSPTPVPTPVVFDSAAYGYRANFPAGMLATAPVEAVQPWDGRAAIGSTGPYTDQFNLPGSKLLFVYGAPTELDLAGYATDGQLKKHDWHDCPEVPEKVTETSFAGDPAILHSFSCGGLRVFSLFVVRDGHGMVLNELTPPGNEAADQAALLELLSGWTWLD